MKTGREGSAGLPIPEQWLTRYARVSSDVVTAMNVLALALIRAEDAKTAAARRAAVGPAREALGSAEAAFERLHAVEMEMFEHQERERAFNASTWRNSSAQTLAEMRRVLGAERARLEAMEEGLRFAAGAIGES